LSLLYLIIKIYFDIFFKIINTFLYDEKGGYNRKFYCVEKLKDSLILRLQYFLWNTMYAYLFVKYFEVQDVVFISVLYLVYSHLPSQWEKSSKSSLFWVPN